MVTEPSAAPDAVMLGRIGIGSVALQGLSTVTAPPVTADHPRILAAAEDPESIAAAVLAGSVVDPEIPVLTVADLGVLRAVRVQADGSVDVQITPTYSGCPAVAAISADIRRALTDAGYSTVRVQTVLSPAWTTDDMTDATRVVLSRYGIAPPGPVAPTGPIGPIGLNLTVRCPHCGSRNTTETSRFGSTACKAMRVCQDCAEPFDHFKSL